MIEIETRLRVGRGLAKTETEASQAALTMLKARSQCATPPALASDGWGGHREALLEVYGEVPPYAGRGRPPTQKQPHANWHYLQVVKQREQGRVVATESRIIYGDDTTLGRLGAHTAYVERTHLTSRHSNSRLVRKTLGFSKQRMMLQAACLWEDAAYNLTRPLKTLRVEVCDGLRRWQQRSPAMAAGLTDHIWSFQELLTLVPIPNNT